MYTLNQVKNILKNWFDNHGMISSVYYLDDFDFNSSRNIIYPVVNISFQNSNISNNVLYYNFQITLASMVNVDNSNDEDNVKSDMIQIAEDFYTYIQNYNGLIFNKISTLNPFTDDTADRTSGIVFNIGIGTIRKQNRCDTPTK
jgi:hypothetical protein